jgi:hypothetical protein
MGREHAVGMVCTLMDIMFIKEKGGQTHQDHPTKLLHPSSEEVLEDTLGLYVRNRRETYVLLDPLAT